MAEVVLRREAEEHVDIAETEVGVEQADAVAETCQRDGEIHSDVRLADAALAAGHGDHGCGFHATAPWRSSPVTHAAMAGAVARCRSSGTRWPVPRYEMGS